MNKKMLTFGAFLFAAQAALIMAVSTDGYQFFMQQPPKWVAPYLEQRALERAVVPPFESGIRSPYGDFTDNDGQRQTAEDVLWECYYQTRKFSQEWPLAPSATLQEVYRLCLLESGATI